MTIIVRRLLLSIPVVILVTVMVFSLLHLIPGDPATVILGDEATPEVKGRFAGTTGLK